MIEDKLGAVMSLRRLCNEILESYETLDKITARHWHYLQPHFQDAIEELAYKALSLESFVNNSQDLPCKEELRKIVGSSYSILDGIEEQSLVLKDPCIEEESQALEDPRRSLQRSWQELMSGQTVPY